MSVTDVMWCRLCSRLVPRATGGKCTSCELQEIIGHSELSREQLVQQVNELRQQLAAAEQRAKEAEAKYAIALECVRVYAEQNNWRDSDGALCVDMFIAATHGCEPAQAALAKVEQLKCGEVMGELSSEEKERRIDEFLSGWGGLKETRKTAEFYLRWNSWDVSLAQSRYWHEVILPYEYQFNE